MIVRTRSIVLRIIVHKQIHPIKNYVTAPTNPKSIHPHIMSRYIGGGMSAWRRTIVYRILYTMIENSDKSVTCTVEGFESWPN